MIRFTPDTFIDAIMRPIAMAAPNGWVYIEIIAPDVRFAIAVVLALIVLATTLHKPRRPSATWALLGLIALSFIPWMCTTGNGRYFMPMLLAVGPLTVALVYQLPVTKAFRLALTLIVVAVQGVALSVNSPWTPWDSWGLARWESAPYFRLDLKQQELDPHATYVSLGDISFSLLAPQFPPTSHWTNLSGQTGMSTESAETKRTQAFLRSASNLQLLLASVPSAMRADFQPTEEAVDTINGLLAEHALELRQPVDCRFIRSTSLQQMAMVRSNETPSEQAARSERIGFWMCGLSLSAVAGLQIPPVAADPKAARAELALRKLELLCPRFFAPGQIGTRPMPNGRQRHYPGADLSVYVLDSGDIYYKHERSMNPHKFGTVEGVLGDGPQPACNIRGRSGLPWEREV